jgi:hypothetical protein
MDNIISKIIELDLNETSSFNIETKKSLKVKKIDQTKVLLWIPTAFTLIYPKLIYSIKNNDLIFSKIKYRLLQMILCYSTIFIIISYLLEDLYNNTLTFDTFSWMAFLILILFFIGIQLLYGLILKKVVNSKLKDIKLK